MPTGRLHEDYSREQPIEVGSPRSFGFVMAVAIPLLAWLFVPVVLPHAIFIGVAFVAVALVRPALLAPLNRAWFRLGLLLGRIVAPVVMAVIFFLVVTPIGLIRRALGKHSLPRGFDRTADSYWQRREPPGPDPDQLPRQF